MRKRVWKHKALALALLVIPLIFLNFQTDLVFAANTTTTLFIPGDGSVPVLREDIPNQTWAANTNLTNAFNLDDYFYDNDTLTYNFTSVTNITIVINTTLNSTNGTQNFVSFYPDYGFSGIRTVQFIAFDATQNATSNIVGLNVTPDTNPPLWSNPSRSSSEVFQNDILTFLTDWTDDVQLSSFIFSINQGAGWVNESQFSFSGQSNRSNQSIQISASGGTTVFWRFYAYDTSGNLNFTDIQNFTVEAIESPPTSSSGGGSSSSSSSGGSSSAGGTGTGAVISEPDTGELEEFSIEPANAINIEVKQGSSKTISIKVTNNLAVSKNFSAVVEALDMFGITFSESQFEIEAGKSKTITIDFAADILQSPDVYFGLIRITTETASKEIPIAVTVVSIDTHLELTSRVIEETKFVKPGEVVTSNITIKNLRDVIEKNLDIYYAITDFQGNIITSETQPLTFSTTSVSFLKNLTLPDELSKGDYIFLARALDGEDILISSDDFTVEERFTLASFLKKYYLLLIILILAIIGAFLMARHHRNKERLRLLNLYLMVTKMNKLVKQGKLEEAINIYIRIKTFYGEPISQTALKNKEELKKEVEELCTKLNIKILQNKLAQEAQSKEKEEGKKEEKSGEKEDAKEKTSEENKEDKKEEPVEENKDEKPAENEKEEPVKEEKEKTIEEPKKESEEAKKEDKPAEESKEESKNEKAEEPAEKPAEDKKAETNEEEKSAESEKKETVKEESPKEEPTKESEEVKKEDKPKDDNKEGDKDEKK